MTNRISPSISKWAVVSFATATVLLCCATVCASDDEALVQRAFAEKWGVDIHRRSTTWSTKKSSANPVMWVVRAAVPQVNAEGDSLNALDIITRVNGVPASTSALLKAVSADAKKPVRITVISSTQSSQFPDGSLSADDTGNATYRTILLDGASRGRTQGRQAGNASAAESPVIQPIDLTQYKLLPLTEFVDAPEKHVGRGADQGFVRMPLWLASQGVVRMRDSDSAGQEIIDGYGCFAADGERPGDRAEYVGNVLATINRGKNSINIIFASREMGRHLKDSLPIGHAIRFESLVTPWVIEDNGQAIYGVSIHYLKAKGASVFDKASMSLKPGKPIVLRADVYEKRADLRRQVEAMTEQP